MIDFDKDLIADYSAITSPEQDSRRNTYTTYALGFYGMDKYDEVLRNIKKGIIEDQGLEKGDTVFFRKDFTLEEKGEAYVLSARVTK